jgi:hypothetical protein
MYDSYPWESTPKGGSFFVPTLEPEKDRVRLLIDSQRYRVKYKATCGVMHGMLGVLLTRVA